MSKSACEKITGEQEVGWLLLVHAWRSDDLKRALFIEKRQQDKQILNDGS